MKFAFALFLSIVGVAAWPALGQGADPELDSSVLERLRAATEPLERAAGFRVKTRATFDVVQEDGRKLEFGSFDEATIRRPDRVYAHFERDDGRRRFLFYDGATLSLHYPAEGVYGQFPVPETIDETLDYLELDLGMPLPLADLFYSDLSALGSSATSADVVGPSRVLEWDCDQFSFRGEHIDHQVWIERGESPRLRKIVITYKDRPGAPQFRAVFLEWDLEVMSPDESFVFTPPEGTERVPTLARPARPGGSS